MRYKRWELGRELDRLQMPKDHSWDWCLMYRLPLQHLSYAVHCLSAKWNQSWWKPSAPLIRAKSLHPLQPLCQDSSQDPKYHDQFESLNLVSHSRDLVFVLHVLEAHLAAILYDFKDRALPDFRERSTTLDYGNHFLTSECCQPRKIPIRQIFPFLFFFNIKENISSQVSY